ncbi:MoaD/ThiS family protein [Rhodococcus sp. SGAir0479]|uniref:MoaD/ThiS family protein n=1 Tax=Rhodococcus sp. SGAir0479 TaxID=2567884 RepID=UPI0010CCB39A|nr:MoaD/ThiS family protein [Rhodococcus sp. SGAir0479]QCQ93916.1 MoaD/ThiS family protein [Rhodococcus sp. SGAir0479]
MDAVRATPRTVEVRYFAAAAEAAERPDEVLSLPADADLADLRSVLVERYGPRMEKILAVAAYLVDSELTRDPARPVGAQVDVLPPFAGG